MHPSRWRAQGERWLALARRAQEDGNLRWAESLTARAREYLDRAASLEAAHGKIEHAMHETEGRVVGKFVVKKS